AYPALRRLREVGLVRAIGCALHPRAALAAPVAEIDGPSVLRAGRFTLLDHEALGTLLPLCAQTGPAVVVGGVFNTGLLADPSPGAMF
ncbi:aldo/keto reductase, partial [Streptomyces sp. DT7]